MRQRRQAKQSAPVEGHQFCPLCGEAVPVSPDGRCDLGHRVNAPHVPSPDADQDASPGASPDAGSSWTPDHLPDADEPRSDLGGELDW